MVGCKNCGSFLRFDIAIQRMRCDRCMETYRVEDVKEVWLLKENWEDAAGESGGKAVKDKKEIMELYEFTCPYCGDVFYGDVQSMGGFCRNCGVSVEVDGLLRTGLRPKKIIPFQKTKGECQEAFEKMLRKTPFLLEGFKDEVHRKSFRPVYFPDDAAASPNRVSAKGVGPFQKGKAVDFLPGYMTGFYADIAEAFKEPPAGKNSNASEGTEKPPAGENPNAGVETENGEAVVAEEPVLCPVWLMSYQNNGRVAFAAVNGQTGRVASDLPVEPKKLLFLSFLLMLPLFFLFEKCDFLMPFVFLGICSIGCVVSAFFLYRQGKLLQRQEGLTDREEIKFRAWEYGVFGGLVLAGVACLFFALRIPIMLRVAGSVFFLAVSFLIFCFAGKLVRERRLLEETDLCVKGILPVCGSGVAALLGMVIAFFQPIEGFWYYGCSILILYCILAELLLFLKNYNYMVTCRPERFRK